MQLIAEGLRLYRGTRLILRDLSFAVSAGEALVLTGPNGAGKTTLIRAIAGFLPLAAGTIRLEGTSPDADIAEHCHFIGHRDAVKSSLTVEENATFFARYLGTAALSPARPGEAVHAALEHLGLAALAEAPAAWLSAGQRRRLGLTRLLLARRPVWLLDEPTVSLDAAAVATLADIIAAHRATGGIVVAATHIPLGLAGARELQLTGPAGAEDRP
jgi:heme exporter protein A